MADRTREEVAIITGGAAGIGRAIGAELASVGVRLVLIDRNEEALANTVREFTALGYEVEGVDADVRDLEQMHAAVTRTNETFGRIDFMFNNAGVHVFSEFQNTTVGDWDRLIDVNIRGVVHGTLAAYSRMREQGFGTIVNVASVAGLAPAVCEAAYSATKHAVVGLSTSLRAEAASCGVRVCVACPALTETGLLQTTTVRGFDHAHLLSLAPCRPMSAAAAAKTIVRGARRGKAVIPVSFATRMIWYLNRLLPGQPRWIGRAVFGLILKAKRSVPPEGHVEPLVVVPHDSE